LVEVDTPRETVSAASVCVMPSYSESFGLVGLEAKGKEKTALAAALAATGVPRITGLGELQRPTLFGTHGGVHRLLPFLLWSTVELGASKRSPATAKRSRRKRRSGRSR